MRYNQKFLSENIERRIPFIFDSFLVKKKNRIKISVSIVKIIRNRRIESFNLKKTGF